MTEIKYTGPSSCTLLTLLFVGLKLTGNIDWSWWWVLSPIWLPIAVLLFVLICLFVANLIVGILK